MLIEELINEDDIPKIHIKDPKRRGFAKELKKNLSKTKETILPLHIRLIAKDKLFIH
jgi:hypothetical protein